MCFESQGFSGTPGACTLPQASVLKAGRAPGLWHKHRSLGAQGRAVASLFFVFFPSSFEVYVFPVGTEFTSDVVLLFGTTDTLALLCIYIDVYIGTARLKDFDGIVCLQDKAWKICTKVPLQLLLREGFLRWLSDKESPCQCSSRRRRGFNPWFGKIPWRKK